MRGNIMYSKWQSIKYASQQSFLINDFLQSFLTVFGQNKYSNLRRYWTIFCHKTEVVKITVLLCCFDNVYFEKAISYALLPLLMNTNFEETAFDVLLFNNAFQFGCLCMKICLYISNYRLNKR